MRTRKRYIICLLWLILLFYATADAKDTIYIVQEAWHTGIVLKTASVSPEIWPEINDYRQHKYVDISWGDEKYYQKPGINILLAARAVLFPTNAVIRLLGFSRPINRFYAGSNKMQVVLDSIEFNALCHFIANSFQKTEKNNIIPSEVFGKSHLFFLAQRKYHLFRTCNTWVLLALKQAGLKVSSFMGLTAGQLFRRLEKIDTARYTSKN